MILVSEKGNTMSQFADHQFTADQLPMAIRMLQNCTSPSVVYGAGTTPKEAEQLAVLKRKAHFIPVFPATNGYHAKVLGLRQASNSHPMEMVYLLLGDTSPKEDVLQWARKAKFLVVHTSYHGPITETADIILPSLLWYEQDGSLYNLEGKKVPVRRAVPLPAELIPENEVFTHLAARL